MNDLVLALQALAKLLRSEIAIMREILLAGLPALARIEPDKKDGYVTALAYGVLETRWGFPDASHSLFNGTFSIGGYSLTVPREIEPELDALVNEVPHGTVPDAVMVARKRLQDVVDLTLAGLWSVQEFGTDAELDDHAEPTGMRSEAARTRASRTTSPGKAKRTRG